MTINDYTLQSTIERNKQFYLDHYGKLDQQWIDEVLVEAMKDYYSCKGRIENFTDDDWETAKEYKFTKEQLIELLKNTNTIQN